MKRPEAAALVYDKMKLGDKKRRLFRPQSSNFRKIIITKLTRKLFLMSDERKSGNADYFPCFDRKIKTVLS